MKIQTTLGTLSAAIRQIDDYKRDLDRKIDLLAERLAVEVGFIASHLFSEAAVNLHPNGDVDRADVKVTVDTDNKIKVVFAEGKEAVFVEFGAGVYSNAKPSPHPKGEELGFTIGSYGKGRGNRLVWGYPGPNGKAVLTRGTPAAMPMYRAAENVRDRIIEIAREVFK